MKREREVTVREFTEISPRREALREKLSHEIYMRLISFGRKYGEVVPQEGDDACLSKEIKDENLPRSIEFPDIEIPFVDSDGKNKYKMMVLDIGIARAFSCPLFQVVYGEEGEKFKQLFLVRRSSSRGSYVSGPDDVMITRPSELLKAKKLINKIIRSASRVFPKKTSK